MIKLRKDHQRRSKKKKRKEEIVYLLQKWQHTERKFIENNDLK